MIICPNKLVSKSCLRGFVLSSQNHSNNINRKKKKNQSILALCVTSKKKKTIKDDSMALSTMVSKRSLRPLS